MLLGNRILDYAIPEYAFDMLDDYIESRFLRNNNKWNNNNNNNNSINNNNNNRRSDISGSSNNYHLHRVLEVEPLNSHATSIRQVFNNNNSNSNSNSNDNDNDTSYYYMPPHHLRQTIESTGLHNMPRRNARLVPPKETRNHRRPPLHPDIFYADSDSTTDTLSTDAPATTNEDDDTIIDITAPSLLSINTSHGGEVDDDDDDDDNDEDDDEDSIDNMHYFLLPADFESTTTVATMTRSHREDEVDAVSFAYSESTVIGEEWCDEVGWELINEESNELFGVPLAPAQEEEVVVVVEELPQELLSEVEVVDDGTAEVELFEATDVEAVAEEEEEVLEEEAHVDEGGEEVTAVLLGSIWVKHPKYTCMVRRSSRVLLMMSVK
jgi:hypothetical protein